MEVRKLLLERVCCTHRDRLHFSERKQENGIKEIAECPRGHETKVWTIADQDGNVWGYGHVDLPGKAFDVPIRPGSLVPLCSLRRGDDFATRRGREGTLWETRFNGIEDASGSLVILQGEPAEEAWMSPWLLVRSLGSVSPHVRPHPLLRRIRSQKRRRRRDKLTRMAS